MYPLSFPCWVNHEMKFSAKHVSLAVEKNKSPAFMSRCSYPAINFDSL